MKATCNHLIGFNVPSPSVIHRKDHITAKRQTKSIEPSMMIFGPYWKMNCIISLILASNKRQK